MSESEQGSGGGPESALICCLIEIRIRNRLKIQYTQNNANLCGPFKKKGRKYCVCVCVCARARWADRPCSLLGPPLTPTPPPPPPSRSPFTPPPAPAPPPSRPSQHSDIIITRVWPLISNVNIFHIDECAVCPHCAQNSLQPSSGHESLLCHTHTHTHTQTHAHGHVSQNTQIHTKQSHSHTMHMPVSARTNASQIHSSLSHTHTHIHFFFHTR